MKEEPTLARPGERRQDPRCPEAREEQGTCGLGMVFEVSCYW